MPIPIEVVTIPTHPGLAPLDGGGRKMILHTTEVGLETNPDGSPGLIAQCRSDDDAVRLPAFRAITSGVLASWRAGRGYPTQLLVDAPNRRAIQCVAMDRGGYALEDTAGGVRTNRAGGRVVQVEMVGHAGQFLDELRDSDWRWLGDLLRQVCEAEGIPWVFPCEFVAHPRPAYGLGSPYRLTGPEYQATAGVIGHQHCPENAHGDPGLLRLDLMTAGQQPWPPPDPDPTPQPTPTPSSEDDSMTIYLVNSEPRMIAGLPSGQPGGAWPPGWVFYAVERGRIRNVRPAERRAINVLNAQVEADVAAGRAPSVDRIPITPTPNNELDDAIAWTAENP